MLHHAQQYAPTQLHCKCIYIRHVHQLLLILQKKEKNLTSHYDHTHPTSNSSTLNWNIKNQLQINCTFQHISVLQFLAYLLTKNRVIRSSQKQPLITHTLTLIEHSPVELSANYNVIKTKQKQKETLVSYCKIFDNFCNSGR